MTHYFEEVVGETLDRGLGAAADANTFSCGLTGGSAALIFLGALREASVDWSHITTYWGDERAVPPDSPDSNYGLAEQMLLKPLGARAPNAVRMAAEVPDLKFAARQYAKLLPQALDLLLLGAGDDGHVCSLFPGHRVLQVSDTYVTYLEDSPKPPPRRMTITMPYILRAHRIWIVMVGERKRLMLERALSSETPTTPLELVIAQAPSVSIFTDQVVRRR
jgi:6-phosphogluconolactonase